MKQSVEREVVLGRRSCLGVRIGRVWTVGCPNDLEARASSLELRSFARKQVGAMSSSAQTVWSNELERPNSLGLTRSGAVELRDET